MDRMDRTENNRLKNSTSDKDSLIKKDLPKMGWDFQKLLTDERFTSHNLVETLAPAEFTMEYYERTGLGRPVIFHCEPEELGIKIPNQTFSVDDIVTMVGAKRRMDVINVDIQATFSMSLGDFAEYFKLPPAQRQSKYNVLSLEFSSTKLEDFVRAPSLIAKIDWINIWPDRLRQRCIEFDGGMWQPWFTYPNVQNYCILSVAGSYTEYHMDYGGSSVWLYILKGQKIFWLIEPTDKNLKLFESFQRDHEEPRWFGELVEKCERVELNEGDTFLLPGGWIHSVYTPKDSIVMGGNYVHTLQSTMQLRIQKLDKKMRVASQYRFPFADKLVMYFFSDFVEKLTGKAFLQPLRIDVFPDYEYVGEDFVKANRHHAIPTDDKENRHDPSSDNMVKLDNEDSQNGTGLPTAGQHSDKMIVGSRAQRLNRRRAPKVEIGLKQVEMDKISPRCLLEMEVLCEHMSNKRLEPTEGITRPTNLIKAVKEILKERRKQVVEKGVDLPARNVNTQMTSNPGSSKDVRNVKMANGMNLRRRVRRDAEPVKEETAHQPKRPRLYSEEDSGIDLDRSNLNTTFSMNIGSSKDEPNEMKSEGEEQRNRVDGDVDQEKDESALSAMRRRSLSESDMQLIDD